jgi:hypothetical protein
VVAVCCFGLSLFLFPGQRLGLAFTIATGFGRDALQSRIDAIESKAVQQLPLSAGDRAFLADFYATLATGAKLTVIVAQTGRLMDHYLSRSGEDFQLDPIIFTGNAKVQAQAELLRKRANHRPCHDETLSSPVFYMPDPTSIDSVFGLYHGRLMLTRHRDASGQCVDRWRAEVPWVWPSYRSLRDKYGDPHAESFPLPNALSILRGRQHALFVDNGLGHHLEQVGLAKSFLAFAEWSDDPGDD